MWLFWVLIPIAILKHTHTGILTRFYANLGINYLNINVLLQLN